jgi:hypothetical protein
MELLAALSGICIAGFWVLKGLSPLFDLTGCRAAVFLWV